MQNRSDEGLTRRELLGAAGVAVGLASTSSVSPLAMRGGEKAVTISAKAQTDASRWPIFGAEEEKAVVGVLRDPGYGQINALEDDWKAHYGSPFVKAHCSGTAAITSMFFALNLPPGTEVLVPSYTFFATIVPLRVLGLVPAFVDVDPKTLNLDVNDAKKRLTKNTRVIFPVHWLGLPCPMDDVQDFADRHGLIVLEDAAHAHGASHKGRPMGTWSRMSIFSFQTSKPLSAMEGGMGMYKEQEDYERATAFGHSDVPASFPASSKYRKFAGTGLGMKLRMNPMAAALARVQLKSIPERTKEGVARVRVLNDRITKLEGLSEPPTRPGMERSYYSSNILTLDSASAGASREAIVKALVAEGVRATAHRYPLQHAMPLYRDASLWHHAPVIPDLPGSEEANRITISLPYLTADSPELIEQYARAFEKVWAHRKSLS